MVSATPLDRKSNPLRPDDEQYLSEGDQRTMEIQKSEQMFSDLEKELVDESK